MAMKLILMGDVNLMDVTDAAEPFRKILGELHAADVVFGNLECCLHLPASRHSEANEGFFADPVVGGEALKLACIHAVGIANNVNYGATSIAASIARLDEVGISHTGAGPISPPRALLRWSNATDYASAFCNAARSIGRPTMRRATTHPASRCCTAILPIMCRWAGRMRESPRPIGPAFHR